MGDLVGHLHLKAKRRYSEGEAMRVIDGEMNTALWCWAQVKGLAERKVL